MRSKNAPVAAGAGPAGVTTAPWGPGSIWWGGRDSNP